MSGGDAGFDLGALRAALDAQRRARGLTWAEAARQINAVGPDVPRHPIAVSTITGLGSKGLAEAAGVLQMLRWLGRSPESFVRGCSAELLERASLPAAGVNQVMRVDTRKLYDALDAQRRARGLTWERVAAETGVHAAHARGLAKGGRTAFPGVMRLTAWLGQPASHFVRLTAY